MRLSSPRMCSFVLSGGPDALFPFCACFPNARQPITNGETSVKAKNFLIATGSEATPFPGLEIDEKRVITSTGAIALEKIPETMLVIGGGIIGLEMAT
jgi:pyruvate/2-oxoglutarate dehydrogenase complex dihydrolipoamide dehydrogenase (E3) component